ncbi:MAG: hypothetical protein J6B11_09740 [Spirochaetales bacterium]|nr:hypothetical protein [Spirochaetales bacterium]
MKKFLINVLCLIVTLSLTSCFSMNIAMNANKESGTLSINYSFDDDDFEILSLVLSTIPGVNGEPFDPSILIDQDEFSSYFNSMNMKDLKLKKATIAQKDGKYTGTLAVDFKNLDQLLTQFPVAEKGFSLSKDKNIYTFAESLDLSQMGDVETLENYILLVKEDKPDWYNRFMESNFAINVTTKTPILEAKGISLSADKKAASYSFKSKDMLGDSKKKLEFLLKF